MRTATERSRSLADVEAHADRLTELWEGYGTRPPSDHVRAERLVSLLHRVSTETERGEPADRLSVLAVAAEALLWLEALGGD